MRANRYKSILFEYMAFNTGHSFNTDTVFSKNALLEITPDDVCRWMILRAFGEESCGGRKARECQGVYLRIR
ncbi:hypothetical protein JG688_00013750 [Phytophthora aleatoria]|uniref:Uncharacterized protein n=1 Tax=Phytophthora aleatoria TaxID=2496075 RepID=A0A8J5M0Y3_9STRA|nr:hypothetical protein JG688_00013750 [Phytophthora aleatoria]